MTIRSDFHEQTFETNVLEKRLDKNCKMQIITRKHLNPEDFDIDVDSPTQGLRKYPFKLDQFQKAAVLSVGGPVRNC